MKDDEMKQYVDERIQTALRDIKDKIPQIENALRKEMPKCAFCGNKLIAEQYIHQNSTESYRFSITKSPKNGWVSFNQIECCHFILINPVPICEECEAKGVSFWGDKYLAIINRKEIKCQKFI